MKNKQDSHFRVPTDLENLEKSGNFWWYSHYPIVKRSVAKCVTGRTFFHTKNAISGTIFAPEQDCSAPLSKVERPVSDRF